MATQLPEPAVCKHYSVKWYGVGTPSLPPSLITLASVSYNYSCFIYVISPSHRYLAFATQPPSLLFAPFLLNWIFILNILILSLMQAKKEQLTPRDKEKDKNDKVKVILRIRPFFTIQDPQECITLLTNHSISINKPGMTTFMKFSYVQNLPHQHDNADSQKDIAASIEDAVRCIFQGIDSTIFAYGQTGAGKTYTIIGNCPQSNSDTQFYKHTLCSTERGILPRALQIIFEEHRKKKNSRITITFFQIYNQRIFDLLTNGMNPLEIRQSRSGQITILGLTSLEVINLKEGIHFLAEGIKNRSTSSTSVNIKSSRSHSIFHLKYQQLVYNPQTKENQVIIANLRVVDLAGSQKFNISPDLPQPEKDLRLLELKSINGSLSKLGHCISALTVQSRTHIPVRDSKLTRILSESLIGAGKIRLIICVSPSISSMNETSSTLQFADRVKKAIFERPSINISEKKKLVDYDQFVSLQEELQLERQGRYQLEKIIEGIKMQPSQMKLLRQNQQLKQEINVLREQLKVYSNHDRINSSRIRDPKQPSPSYHTNKRASPVSVGPKVSYPKRTSQFGTKLKSKTIIKQDGTGEVKNMRTPPKKMGVNSYKDYDSKSNRHSVDQVHSSKLPKKGSKGPTFDRKVKLFMQKSEVDRDLQQKVRNKLLQIKQQISMGNREWLESQDLTQEQHLWK